MQSELNRPAMLAAAHGSATSERYKQELGNMARRRLLTYPDCQAEAIAKHYAAHATIALQILKMLECRRHAGGYPELDRSIQMLVDEIKNNHWHDFGIELEWPNAPDEPPRR